MSFETSRRPSRGVGTGPSQNENRSGTRNGIVIVLSLAVLLGGAAIYWAATRSRVPATESTEATPETQLSVPRSASSGTAEAPSAQRKFGARVKLSSAAAPAEAAEQPAVPPPPLSGLDALPRTAETAKAAAIIGQLFQLGSSTNAPITAEQSELIATQLRQISNLGTPAAAAIHDFLQKDLDLTFGKSVFAGGTGAFSLRTGLIDALSRIGGPGAVSVAAGTLQGTAVPGEISLLARMLDQQAPGEYNQLALAASREALRAAAKDPSSEVEVGPLFQIIQKYGDSSVISDLQSLSSQFRFYSLMALGELPEGRGVPALVEMATGPNAQASGYQQVALRMLAQSAPTSPAAQSVILEMARQGSIPNWEEVAAALAGARLQYVHDAFPQAGTAAQSRVEQTHHVAHGNQNFRTVYSAVPDAQILQNRAVIDQLLGVTSDANARAALQKARDSMSGGGR